jgi:hypothetical protein
MLTNWLTYCFYKVVFLTVVNWFILPHKGMHYIKIAPSYFDAIAIFRELTIILLKLFIVVCFNKIGVNSQRMAIAPKYIGDN